MEPSYKYYENRACKYYPCHNLEHLNCLFCYCPLYSHEKCPGTYTMIEANGKPIRSCMDCTFPHKAENYETIISILSQKT